MKSVLLSVLAVLLVIAVPVRADDPVPSATAAPATATTSAQSAADAARALMLKQFRARGFKEKFRKGEIVWCRKEAPLGSRFEQSVCLSEVQMADKLKNEAELQQELGKGKVCNGDGCVQN